ncbi:Tissue factor pathway inhibitor [Merluccius polli]|uniref:Tissue factor pathway inhibitor n=1 Tax=Merluccius polli TaxID=89951 RepID=A0AA47NP46_MERPO|nr:Tissue factor pathway inhibitor [Merluccius polli]
MVIFNELCVMKEDAGPCKAIKERFYFDIDTGRCMMFEYGGCGGNANNFQSLQACEQTCVVPGRFPLLVGLSVCLSGRLSGEVISMAQSASPCLPPWLSLFFSCPSASLSLFFLLSVCLPVSLFPSVNVYLSVGLHACLPGSLFFLLSVCLPVSLFPSVNVYLSVGGKEGGKKGLETHRMLRVHQWFLKTTYSWLVSLCLFPADKSPCHLDQDPGPCRGLVTRYVFDRVSQECRQFYYGGCYGNANNFRSESECQSKCQNPAKTTKQPVAEVRDPEPTKVSEIRLSRIMVTPAVFKAPSYCALPTEEGPCQAREPRFAYDPLTQTCSKFRYGGCGGNQNNFRRRKMCMRICMNVRRECCAMNHPVYIYC